MPPPDPWSGLYSRARTAEGKRHSRVIGADMEESRRRRAVVAVREPAGARRSRLTVRAVADVARPVRGGERDAAVGAGCRVRRSLGHALPVSSRCTGSSLLAWRPRRARQPPQPCLVPGERSLRSLAALARLRIDHAESVVLDARVDHTVAAGIAAHATETATAAIEIKPAPSTIGHRSFVESVCSWPLLLSQSPGRRLGLPWSAQQAGRTTCLRACASRAAATLESAYGRLIRRRGTRRSDAPRDYPWQPTR